MPVLLADLGEDWDERRIERWYRQRRNLTKLTKLRKFRETAWRAFFYISVYIFGSYHCYTSNFFWDNLDCWKNYPMQVMDDNTYSKLDHSTKDHYMYNVI